MWLRLQVANCCRKFPELLDEICAGTIGLSAAALLAPHLTGENKSVLIAASRNKSKRQVEEMLADLNPKEPQKPGIRAYPSANPAPTLIPASTPVLSFEPVATNFSVPTAAELVATTTPPAEVKPQIIPLGNQRYDLKFSFDAAQKAKLERLGELLGIAAYGPHLAALVERALDIALKAKDPQQQTVKSAATQDNLSRHISMALKKETLERSGYCCEHVSSDGVRCRERSKLQFDHKNPLVWGGTTCSANLQILCVGHHKLKTEIQQGRWIVRKNKN